MCLRECFGLSGQQVISVFGSGGKSSLIDFFAQCYRNEKVLLSTTTKILFPEPGAYDYLYLNDFDAMGMDGVGITYAGERVIVDGVEKLKMPSEESFIKKLVSFQKVFLETDGAKGLQLKGWNGYEPVILPETTISIGVIPITAFGQMIREAYIHRLQSFFEMTGAKRDDIINEAILAKVISSQQGLFQRAIGEKILLINQVEEESSLENAFAVVSLLPKGFRASLSKIIIGSVKMQRGIIV